VHEKRELAFNDYAKGKLFFLHFFNFVTDYSLLAICALPFYRPIYFASQKVRIKLLDPPISPV
jgi:hypothetical protein